MVKAEKYVAEAIPEETAIAICYQSIDLGTQVNDFDKNNVKYERHVWLQWEFPDLLMSSGKPFTFGREYSIRLGDKANLTKIAKGHFGKVPDNFDTDMLLGTGCYIQIENETKADGEVKSKAAAFMKLPMGTKLPSQQNATKRLSLEAFDQEVFESLPQFLRDKIESSPEFKELATPSKPRNDGPVKDGKKFGEHLDEPQDLQY